MSSSNPTLPVAEILPELLDTLARGRNAVLQAPPGAGKTTHVPLALLDQRWLAGRRIVMLEPRRLATRAAAHYMAAQLGEQVGASVGYRVRLDTRVSAKTRIEVVTEGVLSRLLQADPALEDVGLVIFDEFHERSLQADLGLALCLETQAALREDLRLLVMSATLDGAPVAGLLGDAPLITSAGRAYPVETLYLPPEPRPARPGLSAQHAAAAVRRALGEQTGSVLVFLPGAAEIKRVQRLLDAGGLPPEVMLAPLYGDLPQAAQEQAIQVAPPGRRKVVLATAIAETSLTIEGVRVVIDGGWARLPRFDPVSGMTRLDTVRVTQAAADQRRGRAGRTQAGVCYRLWSEGEQKGLTDFTRPEILEADLAPLALDLAQWGVRDAAALAWLTPPPAAAYAQAQSLLRQLGALDERGAITAHGRAMAELAMHPRLAHMLLKAESLGLGALACALAALLGERDVLKGVRDADLRPRLDVIHGRATPPHADRAACARVRKSAGHWRRQRGLADETGEGQFDRAGLLLAFAYPDRIARRRPGAEPRYRLANGRGAFFSEHEPLSGEPFIVAAELDGAAREARVFLAAAVDLGEMEAHFAHLIVQRDFVSWDAKSESVQARRQRCLGELVLEDAPLPDADPAAIGAAMLQGIRQMGLDCLPWNERLRHWRQRVLFLRRVLGEAWPDVCDAALLATLENWLAPYLLQCSRRAHLAQVDLHAALTGLLSWDQQRALDDLAPTHLTVPSGSRLPLDYGNDPPVLAVRLQEMFGAKDTPRLAGGRVAVLLHLLSPARRPVQVTQDLAGFWAGSYHAVKKDLKGRYPKHAWPDDPLQAQPTARAKPAGKSKP